MTRPIRTAAFTVLTVVLGMGAYLRVENQQLDLLTGLLLLAAVVTAAIAITEIGLRMFAAPAHLTVGIRLVVVTCGLMLGMVEIGLRLSGIYESYLEKATGKGFRATYQPKYQGTLPTWFHVYGRHVKFTHQRSEFAFSRTTNSLGLCEREIPAEKGSGEYRVIALGDSYTEGVGAPYEASWPKVLEGELTHRNFASTTVVVNAGVSGSDPWYTYILLREKLLDLRPDLILVAINASDIMDVMIRGGEERFRPDHRTSFTRKPSWEWLYGISYLTRHIVHDLLQYNFIFIRESDLVIEQRKAVDQIFLAIDAFRTLGSEHGFDVVIVIHPDRQEAMLHRYNQQVILLLDTLKHRSDLNLIDVLERWKTSAAFEHQSAESLYWPIDGHNNVEGYALIAKAVADGLGSMHLGTTHGFRRRTKR